jgi:hypothetical protein
MAGDPPVEPGWTPRLGIAYAGEPWASLAWRLVDQASPALSAPVGVGPREAPDPEPEGR